MNGRFLWMAGSLIVILLAITLYAQWLLGESASEKDALTTNNHELTLAINELKDTLQELEAQIYQYASQFDYELDMHIQFNNDSLKEQANSLAAHPAVQTDRKSKQYGIDLVNELSKVEGNIDDFLLVMQSVENRYPGMSILMDMMEPANRQFSEAVELAIQEGGMTDANPATLAEDQFRLMQVLQELRFDWSQKISWFRVFVATRMGAFGNPEVSMKRNLANRAMYAKTVQQQLDKLKNYARKGKLGLQQSESLHIMLEASAEYERFMQQATRIYLSDNWRSDLPLLRDKIQPGLTMTRFHVSLLEERFGEFSDQGLTNAQRTSTILTSFIWLFASAIIGLLLVSYFIYERSIRKPMLQMTSVMEAEASGQEMVQTQTSGVIEILKLQNAFNGMREQVHSRQTRLESIFDNVAEGIIIVDELGNIESINNAALNLFGYSEEELLGENVNVFVPDDISGRHVELMQNYHRYDMVGTAREVMAKRKDGNQFPLSLKVSEFVVGGKKRFAAMVDDVSERHAAMQSLRFMAEHDSLTGLYNRQYIMSELERAVENAKRNKSFNHALLYIDLDNFKYINDTMGHLVGDRLLIEIAAIFTKRIRKGDVLSRLGGDEFAVLLANVDEYQAEQTADYYRGKIANYKFHHDGKSVDVGCSIGVAILNDNIKDKEDILARSDIACHMAKRGGRNRVHLYREQDQQSIEDLYFEMGWSNRIKKALEEDLFVFAYQPIAQSRQNSLFGYEVLLRMRDPSSGELLLPNTFLNAADRFGLMVDIDCWVIEHAIKKLADMQQTNPAIRFSINLSSKSLSEEKILQTIQREIDTHPVNPQNIVFELTEDIAIADISTAIAFIQELKQLGCLTALDDFGVGYSSFSYLKELPVDIVKIDGSFIRNIDSDKLNYALVKSMNDICHTLGKETVAEVVENQKVSKLLDELGLDYQQGIHIGKPKLDVPPEKIEPNVYRIKPV